MFIFRVWQARHTSKHSRPPEVHPSLKGHYITTDHITVRITWGCSAGLDRNFAWRFFLRRDWRELKKKKEREKRSTLERWRTDNEEEEKGKKSFKSWLFWVGPKLWVSLRPQWWPQRPAVMMSLWWTVHSRPLAEYENCGKCGRLSLSRQSIPSSSTKKKIWKV